MHSNELGEIILFKMRVLKKLFFQRSPFMLSNALYNVTIQKLCEELSYQTTTLMLIPSSNSLKLNICRWKSSVLPFRFIANSKNFEYKFFLLLNGNDFLLHAEFDEDVIVICLTSQEFLLLKLLDYY
jgi:hypothetical protein